MMGLFFNSEQFATESGINREIDRLAKALDKAVSALSDVYKSMDYLKTVTPDPGKSGMDQMRNLGGQFFMVGKKTINTLRAMVKSGKIK